MTGLFHIQEQYPEGTEFEKINGFSELIIKAQLINKSDEYRKSIQGKILIIDLGYRKITDFHKVETGDSVEDLIIKAILPQVDGQEKKLVKVPDELKEFLPMASYINLSDNDISELPDWIFRDKLKGLYVANNKLSEFPKWPKNLHNLEELDLSNNQISKISETEFLRGKGRLKYINLSWNELTSIDFFVFNLRNLERIDLSFNKIESYLPPDYFRGNKKLKAILLDFWCEIGNYNNLDFSYTPQLEFLSLEGHEIGLYLKDGLGADNIADDYDDEMMDCFEVFDYLQDMGIYELKKLRYLNLSCNGLSVLPKNFFGIQSLETLELKDNEFSEEQKVFIKIMFPKIETLYF